MDVPLLLKGLCCISLFCFWSLFTLWLGPKCSAEAINYCSALVQTMNVHMHCIWRLSKCLCLFVQQLENSVRKELLDKCGQIRLAAEDNEGQKSSLNVELRRSVSVACGASVVELKIKAPTWVGQVDHLTRPFLPLWILLEYFTLSQRSVIRNMQMTHL